MKSKKVIISDPENILKENEAYDEWTKNQYDNITYIN